MDLPPYQFRLLLDSVSSSNSTRVCCAQALGSEIYVGCSNGQLLRFALQAGGTSFSESYTLLSRQSVPNDKPIEEIVLVSSASRVFVLSDHQIHFYTLPALDPLSAQIKPIRYVETFAVDELQLRKFALSGHQSRATEPLDFCVIKRTSIALYGLKDKLTYRTEMSFPAGVLAKRAGHHICIADKAMYHMVDLNVASSFPIIPVSQADDGKVVKPSITVINENEFLLLSWTGQATMGVFITADGDPVRGTLEWATYPESIALDYPFITATLPDHHVEIHNIETQALIQSIPASPSTSNTRGATAMGNLRVVWSAGGFMVPSSQRSDKLKMTSVPLVRKSAPVVEQIETQPPEDVLLDPHSPSLQTSEDINRVQESDEDAEGLTDVGDAAPRMMLA